MRIPVIILFVSGYAMPMQAHSSLSSLTTPEGNEGLPDAAPTTQEAREVAQKAEKAMKEYGKAFRLMKDSQGAKKAVERALDDFLTQGTEEQEAAPKELEGVLQVVMKANRKARESGRAMEAAQEGLNAAQARERSLR
jgi:hypothetical protein